MAKSMSGSLQVRNGIYYLVKRIPDENGIMKQKWVSLNLPQKGTTKREVENIKIEMIIELNKQYGLSNEDMLFSDWIKKWLEYKKDFVRLNTYEAYEIYYKTHIKPFFDKRKITLKKLVREDIEQYYNLKKKEGLSPSSLKKHSVLINGAIKEAIIRKRISENPAMYITLPKCEKHKGKAYTKEQAQMLLDCIGDEELKPAIVLGLFYGLRRSEVCGLRWQDIDFKKGTMTICNTVVKTKTLIEHEATKSKASNRILYLIPDTIPYLESLKKHREEIESKLGYEHPDPDGHICIHTDGKSSGKPFSPDYVSRGFKRILNRYNLPVIRFHELRHTAGSLLLESKLSTKHIQEYLGHEDIQVTLDTYTHLSTEGKKETAEVMGSILKL